MSDITWSKVPPEPPATGTSSDWYWYRESIDEEPWVIEVWPGRSVRHLTGEWWPELIFKPPKQEPPKLKRGRPKKVLD